MDVTSLKFEYSSEKNQLLIKERGVCFEDVIAAIDDGKLLDVLKHHNPEKYPNQKIYVVEIGGYIYLVPFVRKDKQTVFLKTVFPSRKLTKLYLTQEDES